MLVIDASVAAKFVLTEPDTAAALEVLDGRRRLTGPAVLKYEVTGAVLRRWRSGGMEREPARAACERWHAILNQSPIHLVPVDELYDDALELAFQAGHALMDCLYLAAAQRLGAGLLTADATFHARAVRVYDRVELLARAA